jgi:fumarate reductase flavoprotein subunit
MTKAIVHRAAAMPSGTPHTPVAIVGAGACGLTAALLLRDAGIDSVLLERDASPQGSTALSSGFIPAAGTQVQRSAGVLHDSANTFAADIQNKAQGSAAPHLVQAYTQAIGPVLDTLQQRHGLRFELLDGFLYPGHTQRRMHALPERTGAALVAALHNALLEEHTTASAVLLTQAHVQELWCDTNDRIVGVAYLRPNSTTEYLACDMLLLASNGYGGNQALVKELLPEMQNAVYAGHSGNDGSAVLWGRALGARLADLGGYQGHGSWAVPHGALVTWALMMQGAVQINSLGQRFHDETQGYSEAAVHVLAQPGGTAWNVFDSRLLQLGLQFPDFVAAQDAGAVRHASDAAELAKLIACDPRTLMQTLASTRLSAPYCAVRVTGALFHTQGGLDVDAQGRVVHQDGSPLPNLLAAGGAARGVSGNAVWGYLSGNGLLSAMAGAKIAAQTAAHLLMHA